jgi:hypothetical protein
VVHSKWLGLFRQPWTSSTLSIDGWTISPANKTLNVRGVGRVIKALTLKRFLEKANPDNLFMQETMVNEDKAREVFFKLLPIWYFCGVYSIGLSGGLLTAWNPHDFDFTMFFTPAWILLRV